MITAATLTTALETEQRCSDSNFAVILPVGPDGMDLYRGLELIKALIHWQPNIGWFVIVDDSVRHRGLADVSIFPASCAVVTLLNPRLGRGDGLHGGLFVGIACALSWVQAHTTADFVLKVDTDALAIGPFADSIRQCLKRVPRAGIIGTIGFSCNPYLQSNLRREPELLKVHRELSTTSIRSLASAPSIHKTESLRHFSIAQLEALLPISSHIDAAISHGYSTSDYCQGGAYVVTREMLDRMAGAGYLAVANAWSELPVGEDMILAMYSRAVGLELYDYSKPGEPFGVQARGLPYSPEVLQMLGHSLIHSVKDDRCYSESRIRAFFAARQCVHVEK
jgi:hypothetical protein